MQKTEILQQIRQKLEDNIRELTNSLETQRSASNIDEGDTKDPEDFSQQSESRDMEMALQIQLDTANAQLSKLDDILDKKTNEAETGALVETDKNWFYLGVSLSHMRVGEKELYGVSPDSPAFNSIKGKSSGDHFTIGNNDHRIINVY